MRIADRLPHRLRGRLEYSVWRGHELVLQDVGPNLVLAAAEHVLVQLLAGVADKNITQFGVGSSGVAPAPGDAALTDAVVVDILGVSHPTPAEIAIEWEVARGTATGLQIREFGLFTADDVLVARKTRAEAILKGADIRIAGTWTLYF